MNSKTVGILLAAAILVGGAAEVQAAGLAQAGIKAGVNLSRLEDDNSISQDLGLGGGTWSQAFRVGLIAGGFARYDLNDVVSVRPELLVSMKGEEYEADSGSGAAAMELTYLEIPVTAYVRIPSAGRVRPNLFLGPAVALELSAKSTGDLGSDDIDSRSVDVTLVAGGEIVLDGTWSLEARVSQGFVDIAKEDTGPDIKNRSLAVLVGYAFDLR